MWLKSKKDFDIFNNPLVVPVPLNQYRLNWRGFNQTGLLAEQLRASLKLDILSGILIKNDARPQADLNNKEERAVNVKGKFVFSGSDLNGRSILLIDDVCSTGSTLNECARILKENGSGKVVALVVARG